MGLGGLGPSTGRGNGLEKRHKLWVFMSNHGKQWDGAARGSGGSLGDRGTRGGDTHTMSLSSSRVSGGGLIRT